MPKPTCQLTPGCTHLPHAVTDHPCGIRHIPGSPCRYCGKDTPTDGGFCPDCWTPIPSNHADAKALLAKAGIDLGTPHNADEETR